MSEIDISNLSALAYVATDKYKNRENDLSKKANLYAHWELAATLERKLAFGDHDGNSPDYTLDQIKGAVNIMSSTDDISASYCALNQTRTLLENVFALANVNPSDLTDEQQLRIVDHVFMFAERNFSMGKLMHEPPMGESFRRVDMNAVTGEIANCIQEILGFDLPDGSWERINFIVWNVLSEVFSKLERNRAHGPTSQENP